MEDNILPDTSLCAIVRDEMMNPAGGIIDFVDSTLPFVEEAIIVDTGSVDGTRQVLEEISGKYPNLKIYDRKFDGYASSRNFSLKQVKTRRAFILDADERLTKNDFEKLREILAETDKTAVEFKILDIRPDKTDYIYGLNPRLFNIGRKRNFYGEIWERVNGITNQDTLYSDVEIKHFSPDDKTYSKKKGEWYRLLETHIVCGKLKNLDTPPSQLPSYKEWKAYNPKRELYR
jgi:glycosyltransferase involved in cell wall biosynthesis